MLVITRLLSKLGRNAPPQWRAPKAGTRRRPRGRRSARGARADPRGRGRAPPRLARPPRSSATIRPRSSIQSVGPVFATRTTGTRFSTARSRATRACSAAAQAPVPASFAITTSSRAPAAREARATSGWLASMQTITPIRTGAAARARQQERLARAAAAEAAGPEPGAREQARSRPLGRALVERHRVHLLGDHRRAPIAGGEDGRIPPARLPRRRELPGAGHERRIEVVRDRRQERVARRAERSLPGRLGPHDEVGALPRRRAP